MHTREWSLLFGKVVRCHRRDGSILEGRLSSTADRGWCLLAVGYRVGYFLWHEDWELGGDDVLVEVPEYEAAPSGIPTAVLDPAEPATSGLAEERRRWQSNDPAHMTFRQSSGE